MSTDARGADAPPIIVKSTYRGPITFVVVGAGGTGARVIAPLSQMLRRGDVLAIIDHDIVEDRNIIRQHFSPRDIGMPKATVLADRYRKPGTLVTAFTQRLTTDLPTIATLFGHIRNAAREAALPPSHAAIMIGCVDNAGGRRALQLALREARYLGVENGAAWIDVGNETRGGQAILSLHGWRGQVVGSPAAGPVTIYPVSLDGMSAMPQLLRDAEEATAGCGERIDLQTVQVNHMAAGAAINMASWLMLGLPFTNAGVFFSTLNTMSPIRLTAASPNSLSGHLTLIPESAFAQAAA